MPGSRRPVALLEQSPPFLFQVPEQVAFFSLPCRRHACKCAVRTGACILVTCAMEGSRVAKVCGHVFRNANLYNTSHARFDEKYT
jgi:hypothetical protein